MGFFDFMKKKDESDSAFGKSGSSMFDSPQQNLSQSQTPDSFASGDISSSLPMQNSNDPFSQPSTPLDNNGMPMPSAQDNYDYNSADNPTFPQESFNPPNQSGQPGHPGQDYDSSMDNNMINPSTNPAIDMTNHIPRNDAPFPDSAPSNETPDMMSKNMDIIISKLDAIRMAIQNIDHRLSALESKFENQNNEKHMF